MGPMYHDCGGAIQIKAKILMLIVLLSCFDSLLNKLLMKTKQFAYFLFQKTTKQVEVVWLLGLLG